MSEQRISVDIPDLLLKAGIVTTHDLSEAIQVSKRLQTPVSRVLLTAGTFDDDVYRMAQDLQALMDADLINSESAISSLKGLVSGASTPDEVLDEIYASPKFGRGTKLLGELLEASGIASEEQIQQALKDLGRRTGGSLGSALILRGVLSAGFFPAIFRVQERLRKGKISKAEAIKQLQDEYEFFKKAEESQRFAQLQNESTTRAKDGHRRAPQPSHGAGQDNAPPMNPSAYVVLPSVPRIPPSPKAPNTPSEPAVVNRSQQGSSPSSNDDGNRAPGDVLFAAMQGTLDAIEKSPQSANLVSMLKQAGLLEYEDEHTAVQKALSDPTAVAKMFHAAGFIRACDYENVRRCHQAVLTGELTVEAAAHALKLSRELKVPIEHILDEQNGWQNLRALHARRKEMITGFVAGCSLAFLAIWLVISLRGSRD